MLLLFSVLILLVVISRRMQPRVKRAASPNGSPTDNASAAAVIRTKKLKSITSTDGDDSTLLTVDSILTTALASTHLLIPPLCRVVVEYAAPFVTTRTVYTSAIVNGQDRWYTIVSTSDSGDRVFATSTDNFYSISLRPGKSSVCCRRPRCIVGYVPDRSFCLVVRNRRRVCGISFV